MEKTKNYKKRIKSMDVRGLLGDLIFCCIIIAIGSAQIAQPENMAAKDIRPAVLIAPESSRGKIEIDRESNSIYFELKEEIRQYSI